MSSLLPDAVKDSHNLALEDCIKTALDIDLKKFLIVPYEALSDDLLPILAEENHIMGYEGWNLAETKEQKIDLIKNSFIFHAKKGTISSMESALNSLGVEAKIEEWQDYNGRIGHFRVKFLNIFERELNEDFKSEIVEVIKNYKPLTRILDAINYYICSKGQIYTGVRFKTFEKSTVTTRKVQI